MPIPPAASPFSRLLPLSRTPRHHHALAFSPARPNPVQLRPARPSPAQPNPTLPTSPTHPSPALPSPAQPSPVQPSPNHPSRTQPRPAQPSPAQLPSRDGSCYNNIVGLGSGSSSGDSGGSRLWRFRSLFSPPAGHGPSTYAWIPRCPIPFSSLYSGMRSRCRRSYGDPSLPPPPRYSLSLLLGSVAALLIFPFATSSAALVGIAVYLLAFLLPPIVCACRQAFAFWRTCLDAAVSTAAAECGAATTRRAKPRHARSNSQAWPRRSMPCHAKQSRCRPRPAGPGQASPPLHVTPLRTTAASACGASVHLPFILHLSLTWTFIPSATLALTFALLVFAGSTSLASAASAVALLVRSTPHAPPLSSTPQPPISRSASRRLRRRVRRAIAAAVAAAVVASAASPTPPIGAAAMSHPPASAASASTPDSAAFNVASASTFAPSSTSATCPAPNVFTPPTPFAAAIPISSSADDSASDAPLPGYGCLGLIMRAAGSCAGCPPPPPSAPASADLDILCDVAPPPPPHPAPLPFTPGLASVAVSPSAASSASSDTASSSAAPAPMPTFPFASPIISPTSSAPAASTAQLAAPSSAPPEPALAESASSSIDALAGQPAPSVTTHLAASNAVSSTTSAAAAPSRPPPPRPYARAGGSPDGPTPPAEDLLFHPSLRPALATRELVIPRPLCNLRSFDAFAVGYALGHNVPGDGNCFYDSLRVCACAAGIPDISSAAIRDRCCNYLAANLDSNGGAIRAAIAILAQDGFTQSGVDLAFPRDLSPDEVAPTYIRVNRSDGVWTDSNIMLSAAAGVFQRPLWVLEWDEQAAIRPGRLGGNTAVHGRLYLPPLQPVSAAGSPFLLRQTPNHFQPLPLTGLEADDDAMHRILRSSRADWLLTLASSAAPAHDPAAAHAHAVPAAPLAVDPATSTRAAGASRGASLLAIGAAVNTGEAATYVAHPAAAISPAAAAAREMASVAWARALSSAATTGIPLGGYCPHPLCSHRFRRLKANNKNAPLAPLFRGAAVSTPLPTFAAYASHCSRYHRGSSISPAHFPRADDPIPACSSARTARGAAPASALPTIGSQARQQSRVDLAASHALANAAPPPSRATAASFFNLGGSQPPASDDDDSPAATIPSALPSHRPLSARASRRRPYRRPAPPPQPGAAPPSGSPPASRGPLPLAAGAPALPPPDPDRPPSARPSAADYATIAALDMQPFTQPDGVPIYPTCPHSLNHLLTRCLLFVLQRCVSPSAEDQITGLRLLHLLPRMVFAGLPRGDTLSATSRRNAELERRLCRFFSGDWRALLEEHVARACDAAARRVAAPPQPPRPSVATAFSSDDGATDDDGDGTADLHAAMAKALRKKAARAELLTRLGELSRAAACLTSDVVPAPANATSLAALRPKHPPLRWAVPTALLRPNPAPAPIQLTADSVLQAIRRSPKGSAGGCDGWTIDHLRYLILDDPGLLQSITAVCQLIANGAAPEEAIAFLGAGRLVGLTKPGSPDLRPISIGTAFRRLASRAVLIELGPALAQHFMPFQLSVGVRCGGEAIPRLVQTWLEAHPTHAAVLLDITNAFNSVSRKAIFAELNAVPAFRCLIPMVRSFYEHEGDLWYASDIGPAARLGSAEGTQQGDPLAGALFAIAIHPCLRRAAARVGHSPADGNSGLCISFADDITIVGDDTTLATVLPSLIADLRDTAGCDVNFSKTKAVSPGATLRLLPVAAARVAARAHATAAATAAAANTAAATAAADAPHDADLTAAAAAAATAAIATAGLAKLAASFVTAINAADAAPDDADLAAAAAAAYDAATAAAPSPFIKILDPSTTPDLALRGAILLGAPLGTSEYVSSTAISIFAGCAKLPTYLREHLATSKQCALLLLRKCAAPQAVFWLRILPPDFCAAPASHLDKVLLDCLAAIICAQGGIDADGLEAAQDALPTRIGGVGLTRLSQLAAAAHVASVFDTRTLLSTICPATAAAFAAAVDAALPSPAIPAAALPAVPQPVPVAALPLPAQRRLAAALLSLSAESLAELPPYSSASAPAAASQPFERRAAAASPSRSLQTALMAPVHRANVKAFLDSIKPPPPPTAPPADAAAAAAAAEDAARPLALFNSLRTGAMCWLDARPMAELRMPNDAVTHALCSALRLRLPLFTPGSAAPLRCHRCQALLDPIFPTAHLVSCCGKGDLTRRHDRVQHEAVVPIVSQFSGRPAISQNVTGNPGPGYEMDVVVDGVPNSPLISIDLVVSEPTAASHVLAAAAGSGAASKAAIRNKNRHYRVDTVPSPFPTGEAVFVPFSLEGPGHIDSSVRKFLLNAARARVNYDSPPNAAAAAASELDANNTAAGALYASWTRLLTLVTVRASAAWLAATLRRCAAHTRATDPASSAPLPPRETARRAAAPVLLADVPHSAAARDYYTTSIPHHACGF